MKFQITPSATSIDMKSRPDKKHLEAQFWWKEMWWDDCEIGMYQRRDVYLVGYFYTLVQWHSNNPIHLIASKNRIPVSIKVTIWHLEGGQVQPDRSGGGELDIRSYFSLVGLEMTCSMFSKSKSFFFDTPLCIEINNILKLFTFLSRVESL